MPFLMHPIDTSSVKSASTTFRAISCHLVTIQSNSKRKLSAILWFSSTMIANFAIAFFSKIKKEQFKEMKNDHLELEPFVTCTDCGRKQHQICVLYHDQIWSRGFTCDNCLRKKNRKPNKFNAKNLPTSKLGTYIETRVNNFLKKKEACAV